MTETPHLKRDNDLRAELFTAAEQLVSSIDRGVLLVEDTAAHAAIIRRSIDQELWKLDQVTCGTDAIAAFRKNPRRVVLLDLSLPDMDGLQVLQELLRINPSARVIIITATDAVSKSVQAMKHGAIDYVVKSDPELLREKISTTIEQAWLSAIELAETELVKKTRILELVKSERLHAIETLVRTVCHEVNNPLSGVVALSQLLTQKQASDDITRLASQILEAAKQVAEVVDKLRATGDSVIDFGGKEILNIRE